MRVKMSKQPPLAPTASAVGPSLLSSKLCFRDVHCLVTGAAGGIIHVLKTLFFFRSALFWKRKPPSYNRMNI